MSREITNLKTQDLRITLKSSVYFVQPNSTNKVETQIMYQQLQ